MASLITLGSGLRRIDVICPDGKRRKLGLGDMPKKAAEGFLKRIESLVANRISGVAHDTELARWIASLDPSTHKRLHRLGLVQAKVEPAKLVVHTLADLFTQFFATLNVKECTRVTYKHARDTLGKFVSESRPLHEIDTLLADQWRAKMVEDGFAEATVSRRVKTMRQVFKKGVRWGMVQENPFAGVRAGSQSNKSCQRFISREDARKVLDACPDTQWKLLFALSRFGGLRCPSEHLALRWSDVNWKKGRFRVACGKTSHHEGKEERWVPIFPELRPYLVDAWDEAKDDEELVITRYRDTNSNLRTQLSRIIVRAGLTPWPKVFHNLRSTRQTELSERFPAHVVCGWLGNSVKIAEDHYLQMTDAHFALALVPDDREAHERAQHTPAPTGTDPQLKPVPVENHSVDTDGAALCEKVRQTRLSALGLEPRTYGLKVRCSTN